MATYNADDRGGPDIEESVGVERDHAADLPYGSSGGVTDYFQMRGWGTVSLDFVYWTVTGSPDPTGASAPEVVTDVLVVKAWSA